MSDPPNQQPLDVVAVLLPRWRFIGVFSAVTFGAAVLYAFLAPAWYEARLTVVPSQRSQDSAAMSLAANVPSLSGLSASMSTDSQRIKAVLTSNSVADEVIAKFNLEELYDVAHIEHAREALWEHCSVGVDRRSTVVALTCEDKDPTRAMEMAAYFGEVGNQVFGRISASSAREERRFLEAQVVKSRRDVDEASQKLREFQEKHKIVDLGEQSKAVISAMASIKGELVAKQIRLSYLSSFSSGGEASVAQLQQQIADMEAKLTELEASHATANTPHTPKADGSDSDFFPEAMRVPALRFELERLFREQKIQETVFLLMNQRYEMAKVDEARDTSTFQILDQPTLPTFRSRPRRARLAIFGLLGGAALASGWIVLLAWWRRRTAAES